MATIKDVARLAGVSTSTVSHVINHTRYVSEEISTRVHAAVAQLNYAPSAVARSLKINTTKTFGMLVTVSTNPFFSELVRNVEHACYQQGYHLILCNTEGDVERLQSHLDLLLQRRVDGLLLMCTETNHHIAGWFERFGSVPTVIMDWGPIQPGMDTIQDSAEEGGYLATRHLIDEGHRDIGCLTGPMQKLPAQQRWQGYQRAMQEAGLVVNPQWVLEGSFDCDSGYQAMLALLQLQQRPTAMVAGNDMMAMGLISAAAEHGVRVPDDLSIVGYDDIPFARYMTPALTTIHQDTARIAAVAVQTLLERVQDKQQADRTVMMKPSLVQRASVRRLSPTV